MDKLVGEKKLMYDLIFGEKNEYEIPLLEYISLSEIDEFTKRILNNLKVSGFTIEDDVLILIENKKIWKLKINRNIK